MQLIKRKDWQQIFPSHWQRTSNRKVNDACLEIEAIYKIEFEITHIFDKEGYSIFFNDLYYNKETQTLSLHSFHLPLTKDKKGYLIEESFIDNLETFIEIFHEKTGILPEWKEKVWQTLELLRETIEQELLVPNSRYV